MTKDELKFLIKPDEDGDDDFGSDNPEGEEPDGEDEWG